ncbi:hypothetical protein [Aquabacter spiritensis]|uniref:Invasion protein IalB n=1 Tax=Aquabacter spiritensis TaxID=933073 RepID=A0A4R3M2Y8_9HYPH|nr:hypothetical protein [Aquabacter spiritensis]TCT07581.1 hypothetical protein EDC64_101100 [Aquabacter spiritensis]
MDAALDKDQDMIRAALALTVLAASVLPATAQVKMTWGAVDTDKGAVLAFGVPEADSSLLSFTCERGNPTVLVSSHVGSKGLKVSDPAKIILSAGKVKKEFSGTAIAGEGSAVDVDAGGKLADIKAVLGGAKVLAVEVKGVKQQIVLDGAPDAFAQFEASCQ